MLLHLLLAWVLGHGGARADPTPRPALAVIGVLDLADAPPPLAAPPVTAAPAPAREGAVAVAVPAQPAASAPAGDVAAPAPSPREPSEARPTAAGPDPVAEAPVPPSPGAPAAAGGTEGVPSAPIGVAGPSAPATAADAGPDRPPFEWPPSTRVSYVLTGQVRGEVHGHADVEWVRDGDRYTVRLEVRVGLPVAPLVRRRMVSDGRLTAAGLEPRRYEELTEVALRPSRLATMDFDAGHARLADGRMAPVPAAVQDTASQFIQMAFRFATEPGLAEPGATLALPLALPRRVDTWTYDVRGTERLHTAFGAIDAVHVSPRAPAGAGADVLTAEAWFAPRLRWLPVRIRIHQSPGTFVDLLIERLPDLLGGARDAVVPPPPPAPGPRPADGEADPFNPPAGAR